MKAEYSRVFAHLHDIYALLYGSLRRFPLFPFPPRRGFSTYFRNDGVSLLADALREGVQISGANLRPDARHFLFVNLHQMVVLPVMHRESTSQLSSERLRAMLTEDIQVILREACQTSDPQAAITSSEILRATNSVWEKLGLGGLDIWG